MRLCRYLLMAYISDPIVKRSWWSFGWACFVDLCLWRFLDLFLRHPRNARAVLDLHYLTDLRHWLSRNLFLTRSCNALVVMDLRCLANFSVTNVTWQTDGIDSVSDLCGCLLIRFLIGNVLPGGDRASPSRTNRNLGSWPAAHC